LAIIIREKKEIDGKTFVLKIYRSESGRFVTEKEKVKAEGFDRFLEQKIQNIEQEINQSGLLSLKGQKGKVHRLWYEVGKRLDFVDDNRIVNPEDKKFVWRAIYDHVKNLHDGPVPERALRNPETSHFAYCYYLSKFPWQFVEMAGDWTSWSEFFDRKETKDDPRIIELLGERANLSNISGRQDWLRPLTKAIHKAFWGKDTKIFSREELNNRIESIYQELHNDV
jgi:hypothetical protein